MKHSSLLGQLRSFEENEYLANTTLVVIFTLHNLQMERLERLARDKHSNLLGQLRSLEENEVLRIRLLEPIYFVLVNGTFFLFFCKHFIEGKA